MHTIHLESALVRRRDAGRRHATKPMLQLVLYSPIAHLFGQISRDQQPITSEQCDVIIKSLVRFSGSGGGRALVGKWWEGNEGSWMSGVTALDAGKRGGDKGDNDTRGWCPITPTRKALNWRAMFPLCCGYYAVARRQQCSPIGLARPEPRPQPYRTSLGRIESPGDGSSGAAKIHCSTHEMVARGMATNLRGCPVNTRTEHGRQGGCCYSRKRWAYEILTGRKMSHSSTIVYPSAFVFHRMDGHVWTIFCPHAADLLPPSLSHHLVTSPSSVTMDRSRLSATYTKHYSCPEHNIVTAIGMLVRCFAAGTRRHALPDSEPRRTHTRASNGEGGSVVVRLLASHLCEPGSIPRGVAPGFSHVGIVPDDAADRRVFSGISRFPRPCVPALLRTSLHPHRLSRPLGWCAIDLSCGRLWIRIPGKARVLILARLKPSPAKLSIIKPEDYNRMPLINGRYGSCHPLEEHLLGKNRGKLGKSTLAEMHWIFMRKENFCSSETYAGIMHAARLKLNTLLNPCCIIRICRYLLGPVAKPLVTHTTTVCPSTTEHDQ
ncbi:hypothetical protein PR048_031569 [Dryococelus australis]|uniref:Uncharacterized protein n=1 Tax=Dryococelus australis TaxID=614101 RepID=A0ABQ9G9P7_9NEOP|nr:hypothetical protein PR048_031569 [Dryococelus australis]